jgi:hypothetical protein
MSTEATLVAYELLKTGALVAFRILGEEVLPSTDEAEFGLRLQLKFVADEEEDEGDEDVLRRFARSWQNFKTRYRPLADAWAVYDNSSRPPKLIELGP